MNKRKVKVYYINNTDWALYNFRYPVLQALRRMGFYTGAAASRGKFWTKITDIDDLVPITNYRRKINPLRDILLVIELFSMFLRRKPDIAHFFTIKPVIYGSLAAKLAGVPYIIQTISGLGTVFTDKDVATTLLRKFIITPLYKLICSFSSFIFFQMMMTGAFSLTKELYPRISQI